MLQIDKTKIEERMAQLQMGYNDLAKKYGCKRQWIYKLVNKDEGINTKTIGKLAKALKINSSKIIKRRAKNEEEG